MPRTIYDTLPEDEQHLMHQRNPSVNPDQREVWNTIYAWGWVAGKYYYANKVKALLDQKGYDEVWIKEVMEALFTDVPPFNPQAEETHYATSSMPDSLPAE